MSGARARHSSGRRLPVQGRSPRRMAVLILIMLMAGELVLLYRGHRAGATDPVAQATGRFLSGQVGGLDLQSLPVFAAASSTSTGGPAQSRSSAISAAGFGSVTVPVSSAPPVNLLGSAAMLSLDAVNQYSEASPDGSSRGAAGAVDSSGELTASYPAAAALAVQPLLTGLTSTVSDLRLDIGALSGRATETAAGAQSGDYRIAGLRLNGQSPPLGAAYSNLRTAILAEQSTVDAIPAAVTSLGLGGPVTVGALPNLSSLVAGLSTVTSADGAWTANLQTGAFSVDVATLLTGLGLNLNTLPANTDLLAPVAAALSSQLAPAIAAGINSLIDQVQAAIRSISISVLGLPVPTTSLASVLDPIVASIGAAGAGATAGLATGFAAPLSAALSTVLSLRANVQQVAAGTFSETALSIGLLPTAPTPAAVLALASATVGANHGPLTPPTAIALAPSSGPDTGGQLVTVTGSGFLAGQTSVTIGGDTVAAGQVQVAGAGSLSFRTPAHPAGPVTVTISTPAGTSTPPLAYRYLASGNPGGGNPGGPGGGSGGGSGLSGPVIDTPHDGTVTTDPYPSVAGTGIAGLVVSVLRGGNQLCRATVGGTGRWTCRPATALATGTYAVLARQRAVAGLVSPASNTVTFAIIPPPPVILSPVPGSTIGNARPPIGGTGQPGDRIQVRLGTVIACSATVDANRDWLCSPASALTNGSYTATAVQADRAGLSSRPSQPDRFTVAIAINSPLSSPGQLPFTGQPDRSLVLVGLLVVQAGALLLLIGTGRPGVPRSPLD